MIKKYSKNSKEVEAVQYEGTEESLDEIKELLGEKANTVEEVNSDRKFNLIGKTKKITIYKTDWIVRDKIKENTLFFYHIIYNGLLAY